MSRQRACTSLRTSYGTRLVYDTYDVTKLLQSGSNAIGIQVGEGWYAGRIGFSESRNVWGDTLGAFALLVVTKADGSKETIPTDLTWSSSTGAIITSEIYDGGILRLGARPARLGHRRFHAQQQSSMDWCQSTQVPSGPTSAAPDGPPIRRVEKVELPEDHHNPVRGDGLDFGQNLVGWLASQP
ncbi:hypothetical protein NUW58_g9067 [Xylaria curta]|uniref:Uncharacterized protein n=1 Tax=Xylaria curta TaxID=42375 RepID=A0ACC1N117_9PEZI|nr:hypothetical protein NUW58_g9067 [Xylaria curta]